MHTHQSHQLAPSHTSHASSFFRQVELSGNQIQIIMDCINLLRTAVQCAFQMTKTAMIAYKQGNERLEGTTQDWSAEMRHHNHHQGGRGTSNEEVHDASPEEVSSGREWKTPL